GDWQVELAGRRRNLPPGGRFPSVIRTEQMRRDPIAVLLPAYEEHGPIFALRIFHSLIVFMIGPEANRFILVTDREKFRWREDILSVLLEATDSEGVGLSDEQIRDQVLTLLFVGHDTTTSTVAFLFYELARHPEWAERIAAESERVAPDRAPTAAELFAEMPELGAAV